MAKTRRTAGSGEVLHRIAASLGCAVRRRKARPDHEREHLAVAGSGGSYGRPIVGAAMPKRIRLLSLPE